MAFLLRALPPALLTLLVFASSPARAEEQSHFAQLRRMAIAFANDYSAGRSREDRLSLATHVPGLFAFRFVCQHQPAGGAAAAMLPGDTIESAGQSTITCPGGIIAALEDKTKVTLRQTESEPELKVEAGSVKLTFGKVAFSLLAGDLHLHAEGKSSVQELEVRPEKDAMAFVCNKGNVVATFEAGPNGAKNFLGSRVCRMEMREAAGGVTSQVLPGDAMAIPNRTIAREFRPKQPSILGGQEPPVPINVWLADGNTKLTVTMSTMAAGEKASCEVYLQDAPGVPAKVVKAYTADMHQATVPLDSPRKGQAYFAVCEGEAGAFASQVVFVP